MIVSQPRSDEKPPLLAANEQFPHLPWIVRYAVAAYEAGWTLPPHLTMCAQMVLYGGGCASCGARNAR